MSQLALDLFELLRLSEGGAGTLTKHLLVVVVQELISEGVDRERLTDGTPDAGDQEISL